MTCTHLHAIGIPLMLLAAACLRGTPVPDSPYGVCAHLSRGEFRTAERECAMFREAGIGAVRFDFGWDDLEREPGRWEFSRSDLPLDAAERNGIEVIAILGSDTLPAWGKPPFRHLDAYLGYVKQCAERYRGRVRYFELFNEPNHLRFWGEKPNAADYVTLLAESARLIRRHAPEAKIVCGGLAGTPKKYLAEMLDKGAAEHFDIMNFHPYQWYDYPESKLPGEIAAVQEELKRVNAGLKPLWITEIGYSTATEPDNLPFLRQAIARALAEVGIAAGSCIGVIEDHAEGYFTDGIQYGAAELIPEFRHVRRLTLDELETLEIAGCPAVLLAPGEAFPTRKIPALKEYVRRGGTVIFPEGLPFFFDRSVPGEQREVGGTKMKELHLSWEAWWSRPGVPSGGIVYSEAELCPAAGAVPRGIHRFFLGRNLRGNDRLIPLLYGEKGDYRAPVAALYRLDSDLKGNVIVFGNVPGVKAVSEEMQMRLLPRSILIARACGVERVFWYSFRSNERNNRLEAHFGVTRRSLADKPAAQAFRALTALAPPGSSRPELLSLRPFCLAKWEKPDGGRVYALWCVQGSLPLEIGFSGSGTGARNHLGAEIAVRPGEFLCRPEITYFTGKSDFELRVSTPDRREGQGEK